MVNDQIDIGNLNIITATLKLLEGQVAKIENILDNEGGNPACPVDFILDLTNFVVEKGALATKINSLIKLKEQPVTPPVPNPSTPIGPNPDIVGLGDAISASLNKLNVRQPISNSDLPKFYGDAAEYVPFIECFNYLIEEDDSIPDAMKAQYLKRCLPEKILDGKPNTAYQFVRLLVP